MDNKRRSFMKLLGFAPLAPVAIAEALGNTEPKDQGGFSLPLPVAKDLTAFFDRSGVLKSEAPRFRTIELTNSAGVTTRIPVLGGIKAVYHS